jgi:neutral ceramidase
MKAGFAREKINPPLGTRMFGIGPRDAGGGCRSINDDIYVRALYCCHEGEAALVMSFDLCFVGRAEADRLKGVLGRVLGLLPRQILLSATHTHAGPAFGLWSSVEYEMPDILYARAVEAATVAAAQAALAAAEEAVLSAAATRSSLPISRRLVVDGKAHTKPNPDGAVSDVLPVCLLQNLAGRPICLLFSIATHPTLMRGWEISADICGAACAAIDSDLGADCSLFLQGTAGDSKPYTVAAGDEWRWDTGWQETRETGAILARETIACLENELKPIEPKIRTALVETLWPLEKAERSYLEAVQADPLVINDPLMGREWATRQLESLDRFGAVAETASVLMQGVQLGDGLRLIGIEGEPVAYYGHMILRHFPEGVTFPLGYANGEALYLPTTSMLQEGGMEVTAYYQYGFPAPLAPGMESLAESGLEALKSLGVG